MKAKFLEQFYIIKNGYKKIILNLVIFVILYSVFSGVNSKDDLLSSLVVALNYLAFISLFTSMGNAKYAKLLPINSTSYMGGIYLSQLLIFTCLSMLVALVKLYQFSSGQALAMGFLEAMAFQMIIGAISLLLINYNGRHKGLAFTLITALVILVVYLNHEAIEAYVLRLDSKKYLSLASFFLGVFLYLASYLIAKKSYERRSY